MVSGILTVVGAPEFPVFLFKRVASVRYFSTFRWMVDFEGARLSGNRSENSSLTRLKLLVRK